MKIEKKNKPSSILKKHVNTIHCSNNLSLVQRKLFNVLLYNAYHRLSEQAIFQIPVKDLCILIGYGSRDYKKLKKSIMDLMIIAIEWNVIEQEEGLQTEKWRASSIISAAKIEDGMCTYEFSSIMRELLYEPEMYGKIDLNVMVEFQSSYGLALYENCVRFQGIASTSWLPLDVFRKLMGVPEKSYKKFCDFKKRILDIAVKEVNKYSTVKVTPELRRINRKVTAIKFKLNECKKDNSENDFSIPSELEKILLSEFSLSVESVKNIFSQYGVPYIQEKVSLIQESDNFRWGKIRDISSYLIDALKRNYQKKSSKESIKPLVHKVKYAKSENKNQIDDKQRLIEIRKSRMLIDEYLRKLSKEQYQYLILQFEKNLELKDPFFSYKKYKKMGLDSKVVRSLFDCFVKEIISLEQETNKTYA